MELTVEKGRGYVPSEENDVEDSMVGFIPIDSISLRLLGVSQNGDSGRADISDTNIKFHQRILELSGCALLRDTAFGLLQHMHAVRRRTMREGDRVNRSVVDHMAIIEAIENREGDLAAMLVRDHTMKLHDHIRQTWMQYQNKPVIGM
jgi:DNA-binding GntR family transcriptional regulator